MGSAANQFETESANASKLLAGKTVARVVREERYVVVEFEDGTRLFVDAESSRLELSISGGGQE